MMLKNFQTICVCGFALFAMFFGSGNLVFPLKIGQKVGDLWHLGFIGLFASGIFLPFLGLFVVQRFNGNAQAFFNGAGKFAGFFIPFLSLSLMGSFGVIPRCITVAHGGIEFLFSNIPLFVTSILFCISIYFLCIKDDVIVQTIGKWLSPFKFLSILFLLLVAIFNAPGNLSNSSTKAESIKIGLLTGYELMDLIASFFFSSLTFSYIKKVFKGDELLKFAIKPAILGSFLISVMYFGFLYLGAHYQQIIQDVSPEKMLPTIALHSLGHSSTLFISFVMTISCLTTAVALNSVYARYICSVFPKIGFKASLAFTTLSSFLMSLLSFQGISGVLGPILACIYPSLIFLTIISFFQKEESLLKKIIFYGITILMAFNFFAYS